MGKTVEPGNKVDDEAKATGAADGGNSGTGSTGNSGGRTGGRGSTKREQAEKLPRVVNVDVPGEEKPEEKPKAKRGRPPGSTAKKKATAAKKSTGSVDHRQLSVLLKTICDITAARPGMEVWALSQEEVDQIAKPLAEIAKRHESIGQAASEYADYIALVTACLTIFIPRFMMHQAMKPAKPKQGGKVSYGKPVPVSPSPNKTGEGERSHQQPARQTGTNAPNGAILGNQLSQLIPGLG